MADESSRTLQLFVRLLDGKSTTINFASPSAYGHEIKHRIFEKTKIPTHLQRLICGGYQISDGAAVSIPESTVNLVLSLRGGKGGFGSLLRGAATQAGAKKTNNFDACRDMSGRRLRHVNAEKKLEEWKAGEEERKLERVAQEFLKKQANKVKQGAGNGATQKYVNKYKEESDKCIEAVELALKESFQNGKRKGKMIAESDKSKRVKIWKGKRAIVDSDSDDEISDDEEDEKSVVLDNGSQVFSGTIMNETKNGCSSLSGSCSEEEKDTIIVHESSEKPMTEDSSEAILKQTEKKETLREEEGKNLVSINNEDVKESSDSSTTNTDFPVEADCANAGFGKSFEPLNFENFSSASDIEVLGMERLKNELQTKGMKCGGTLKERAERLFLLKSTPLDKIPKKLMAAKK
uniref:Protein SDE2-like protein n=1 Tax=Noccaea caerulescens TaxID=107243 RepID=A0A1J3IBF4_NOCCA